MLSNNGCSITSFFCLTIGPPLFSLRLPLKDIQNDVTIYAPSFQQPKGYTACSIDQCEDARLDEPPHMPPFPFPLAPSHPPLPHRNHSPEYAPHDQETAPATNTTAPHHRPVLTVHSSLHASLTLPSRQWLAMVHSSPCT